MSRILFDHNVPIGLRALLPDHDVTLAREMGWAQIANGALLLAAERAGFDVMVTADKTLHHQQNLLGRTLAIAPQCERGRYHRNPIRVTWDFGSCNSILFHQKAPCGARRYVALRQPEASRATTLPPCSAGSRRRTRLLFGCRQWDTHSAARYEAHKSREVVTKDWSQWHDVESVPGKVSGAWVVKGTRVQADAIVENAKKGHSVE